MTRIMGLFLLLYLPTTQALVYEPITTKAESGGAGISYTLNSDVANKESNTFLASEKVSLSFSLEVADEDVGFASSLYVLVKLNGKNYMKSSDGSWHPVADDLSDLKPFSQKTLTKNETISAFSDKLLEAGEYLIYGGYLTKNGSIKYNSESVSMVVFADANSQKSYLHRVQNSQFLLDYLNKATNANDFFIAETAIAVSGAPTAAVSDSAASGSSTSNVSGTNLQEVGVDEADRIKTDGSTLYSLNSCGSEGQECLTVYQMTESPAGTSSLGSIEVGTDYNEGNIYLRETDGKKTAVWLSSQFSYSIWAVWDFPGYWGGNKTHLNLLDVTDPSNMQKIKSITLNGTTVSSRMVGDTLYLLTRNSPTYSYGIPEPIILAASKRMGLEKETETNNTSVVSIEPISVEPDGGIGDGAEPIPVEPYPTEPVILNEDDLLPKISFDGGAEIPLVDATNCYLPVQNSNKNYDSTTITLTAIPLDNPEGFNSVCIAGSIETFYMSTESIYLATSQYEYTSSGNEIIYDGSPDYTTDIHKFSFDGGTLSYKGSGQVPGHLGWEQDKRSFRFGENNGVLKVATSIGESWTNDSRTRVGVFKEDANANALNEVSFLDNLGKPGEKLYAARFIGDRGYLVTFKVTDPLYVLDFSNPESPQIKGELEIDGYSDYLHPIGENYLIGLGKDAIADVDTDRGAWYQGVKVSLFDVSDGNNLKEVNSIIIGKRGTHSQALYDHHAFTWLDNGDGTATMAIPVDMHDTVSPYVSEYSSPSDPWYYYDVTHSGLYVFNVNSESAPGVSLSGKLLKDLPASGYYGYAQERSVIQGGSIHYIHDSGISSSAISDLQ